MTEIFKYGVIQYTGAQPGDFVRFVPGPRVGQPGAITQPRVSTEINAVLESVKGTLGYCKLKPQLQASRAGAEGGAASGILVDLPVSAGGRLRID